MVFSDCTITPKMNVLLCFGHGNGPLARCLDFLSSYCSLHTPIKGVINIYLSCDQLNLPTRRILQSFKVSTLHQDDLTIKFFFLPELSAILKQLPTLGDYTYDQHLLLVSSLLPRTQLHIDKLFSASIQCVDIDSSDCHFITYAHLDFAITREIPYKLPLATFEIGFGPQSRILSSLTDSASFQCSPSLDHLIRIYQEVEKTRTYKFLSIPSSMHSLSLGDYRLTADGYNLIPPIVSKHLNIPQNIDMSESFIPSRTAFYVYISGTGIIAPDTIAKIASKAQCLGLALFSNNPSILGFGNYWDPSDLHTLSPLFILARLGWGIAWTAMYLHIPLISLPLTNLDDPEISCNMSQLIASNLALPYSMFDLAHATDLSESLLKNIHSQQHTVQLILERFGSLYGQDVAASMV